MQQPFSRKRGKTDRSKRPTIKPGVTVAGVAGFLVFEDAYFLVMLDWIVFARSGSPTNQKMRSGVVTDLSLNRD